MTTRRVNLLPPELLQRRRTRQLGIGIAGAGFALVAALGLFYVVQDMRLRSEKTKLQAQQSTNDVLRDQVGQLSDFDKQQNELRQKTRLLTDLTKDEVRWSILLADISLVIPSEVWLTGFTGAVQNPDAAVATGPGILPTVGTISLNGTSFSHLDVAKWLTRLTAVDELIQPYLSLSTRGTIGTTDIVTFTSSVQMSEKALRRNQRGAGRVQ